MAGLHDAGPGKYSSLISETDHNQKKKKKKGRPD